MLFGQKKRPDGSALGRTELKKYMFYVSETQTSRLSTSQNIISYFEKNIQVWLPPQIGVRMENKNARFP